VPLIALFVALLATVALALIGTATAFEVAAILARTRITVLGCCRLRSTCRRLLARALLALAELLATAAMKILAPVTAMLTLPLLAIGGLSARFLSLRRRMIVAAMTLALVARPAIVVPATRPPDLDQVRCRRRFCRWLSRRGGSFHRVCLGRGVHSDGFGR